MDRPTIEVVGFGPLGSDFMTDAARRAIASAPVVRLRTRRHPAASDYTDIASYDEMYDAAATFDELYDAIVTDLVRLAMSSPNRRVVYVVPGSPVVAERTVELIVARDDVDAVITPAVSVIDIACARLGRDPMACGLRVIDALASNDPLRGPGPLLVLQTHSVEVLALLADRLPPNTPVAVLHHLGASDEHVGWTIAGALTDFVGADHLTSVWVDELRTSGVAIEDLMVLTHTLRERCVWDQEQTHESLTPHLLEEAYETIDAIERFVAAGSLDARDLTKELGDLLFQVAFHCELGSEEGQFDLTRVADEVRNKLVYRHPHVFADVQITDARDAARQWEELKQGEKDRPSAVDSVPMQLPALSLYAKLVRVAGLQMQGQPSDADSVDAVRRALDALEAQLVNSTTTGGDIDEPSPWADLLSALSDVALRRGVDLESVFRRRALQLRAEIAASEKHDPPLMTT